MQCSMETVTKHAHRYNLQPSINEHTFKSATSVNISITFFNGVTIVNFIAFFQQCYSSQLHYIIFHQQRQSVFGSFCRF